MKRAHGDGMKAERRQSILRASRQLVTERGWDGFRLEDVAASLGLVKGTLYRYFPTRQDLLAALVRAEMDDWRQALADAPVHPRPGPWLASSLVGRELLVSLLTILHTGIESGLSADGLREIKTYFAIFLGEVARELEDRFPGLAGKGTNFLLEAYALMVGGAQLAWPPAPVRDLIASQAGLAVFRIDFGAFLTHALDQLFFGYLAS